MKISATTSIPRRQLTIAPRGSHIVSTQISIEFDPIDGRPVGALVRDKSSMAARRVICTAGVIDSGYRGEIRIVMENLGDQPAEIHAGDKIANLIPYPVLTSPVQVVEELADRIAMLADSDRQVGADSLRARWASRYNQSNVLIRTS